MATTKSRSMPAPSPCRRSGPGALALLTVLCFQLGCWSEGRPTREPTGGTTGGVGGTGGGAADAASTACLDAQAPSTGASWVGIVGTGQSLAVGTGPVTTTSQPYNNLKLALGGAAVPPWNPDDCRLSMVPLIEPIRPMGSGFPRPYPGNIWGETPHAAMGNQITALVKAASPASDYITVHTVIGESGQGMIALKKQTGPTDGETGRAYAATLFEAAAITRLARAAGASYRVGAIVMTHGETDSGSSAYKDELIQFLADSNADLAAITGQTEHVPMLLSQQFAYPGGAGQRPVANLTCWRLGVERAADFVCTGPKYQHPGYGDGVHLSAAGYTQLGEKTGQVYYERVVLGRDWKPLQPTTVERSGQTITVNFHVPVPPLRWDDTFSAPTEWPNGRGFELRAGPTKIEISSVAISGNAVVITAATAPPATGVIVGYALTANATKMATASNSFRWGHLRDSDPFVGSTTGVAQPNYAVAFETPVP
jgi:hypothetical protein